MKQNFFDFRFYVVTLKRPHLILFTGRHKSSLAGGQWEVYTVHRWPNRRRSFDMLFSTSEQQSLCCILKFANSPNYFNKIKKIQYHRKFVSFIIICQTGNSKAHVQVMNISTGKVMKVWEFRWSFGIEKSECTTKLVLNNFWYIVWFSLLGCLKFII